MPICTVEKSCTTEPSTAAQYSRAEAVGDRAHDFYEAGRAPIQWNDVADADTIAALQIPAGFGFGVGDAFPSSESVARSVVAALAARSAG
mgnify:CR=1 FL=1